MDVSNLAEAQTTSHGRSCRPTRRIDGVLALNPAVAVAAVDAISDAGSKAKLATFDLSADVVDRDQGRRDPVRGGPAAVPAGLPADHFLTCTRTTLNTVGGGLPVYTGPGFVTKDNADAGGQAGGESGTR